MGSFSSAFTADVEDFNAIVSLTERRSPSTGSPQCGTDRRAQTQMFMSPPEPLPFPEALVTSLETWRQDEDEKKEAVLLSVNALSISPATPRDCPDSENKATVPPKAVVPASSSVSSEFGAGRSPPSLFSGALSAVLLAPATEPRAAPLGPPTLENLRLELRDLRHEMEQLKTQHKREIKLLMNELDEEKRVRLSLQMEVGQIKKHMAK